jgi:hypothetical protein
MVNLLGEQAFYALRVVKFLGEQAFYALRMVAHKLHGSRRGEQGTRERVQRMSSAFPPVDNYRTT